MSASSFSISPKGRGNEGIFGLVGAGRFVFELVNDVPHIDPPRIEEPKIAKHKSTVLAIKVIAAPIEKCTTVFVSMIMFLRVSKRAKATEAMG
jgi:hypothetical protein